MNHIQVVLEKSIAKVTLNRTNAANALCTELLHELTKAVKDISENKQIRVVILTGSGEKAFCAGADLKERLGMNEQQVRETVKLIGSTISAVEKLAIPVICAINGVAFGGGLELALACDIRIASEQMKCGLTETALGIIPGAGGTQRLPRLIGIGKAKEMIFTAKRIDAVEAERIGLVEKVVPFAELDQTAMQMAKTISANGPVAIRAAKRVISQGMDGSLEEGMKIEASGYEEVISTKDRLEGLKAFQEKRPPVYSGE